MYSILIHLPTILVSAASTLNSYGPPGSYATTGRHPQNQPLNVTRLHRASRPSDPRNNPYIDTPASLNRTGSAASAAELSQSTSYRIPAAADSSGPLSTVPSSFSGGLSQQWGPQSLSVTGPLRQAPPPPPPGRSGSSSTPQSSHRTLLATRSQAPQHMQSSVSPLVGRHPRSPIQEAHSAATSPMEQRLLTTASSNPQSPTAGPQATLLPSYMPPGFAAESMQSSRAHPAGYNSNPHAQQQLQRLAP